MAGEAGATSAAATPEGGRPLLETAQKEHASSSFPLGGVGICQTLQGSIKVVLSPPVPW